MARLFLDTLARYRREGRFLLHEFVLMPDHFHLLLTPAHDVSLEKFKHQRLLQEFVLEFASIAILYQSDDL